MMPRFRHSVRIAILGAVACLAPAQVGVGSVVPDFSFVDFTGKARAFHEFKGRVVLLDFWATWCKPCLADIPHLTELYSKYHGKGFDIIGMDAETLGQASEDIDQALLKDQEARARQIVAVRGAVWPHGNNATAVPLAVKVFAAKTLPTKVLIDAQGKIAARIRKVEEIDALLPGLLDAKR
jgi:thiol-disulfide isomerase/thioredoxin